MLNNAGYLGLALQALKRNRIQTLLALLGVMVGVGALVASMAIGRGAQAAIQQQLLAAGANMIVVTAGNFATGRPAATSAPSGHGDNLELEREPDDDAPSAPAGEDEGAPGGRPETAAPGDAPSTSGGGAGPALGWHQREAPAVPPVRLMRPGGPGVVAEFYGSLRRAGDMRSWQVLPAHFEDDPLAVHDHPTAAERLGDSMAGLGSAATLTVDDADAIRQQIAGVQFVASGVHENARVIVDGDENRKWLTRLHGTEADLPSVRRGWVLPVGRFLSETDVRESRQVMALGRVVADRLFGENVNPVGQRVLLWNQPFEIVGVVGSSTWAAQPAPGDDQFDAVYVPVTTVHRLLNLSKLNTISVTTKSAGETTRVAGEIVDLLRQRHGITEEMADDFTVKTQAEQVLGKGLPPELAGMVAGNLGSVDALTMEQLAASMQRSNRTLIALLAGVAFVSLLVGGIGVMNLLFLSVTQRTREIGLRIAMGARRRDIAAQFVAEALLLSIVGGLLGAAAGTVAAFGLEGVFAWSTDVSPLSAVLAIVVAVVLGALSGMLPARQAAALDPINALQHE
jgi:putative ABC transport system permease protein